MCLLSKGAPARNSGVRQLSLFPSTTPTIVGQVIATDRPCPRCGCVEATIGSSKGPNHAELRCAECERHVGWLDGWRYRALTGAQIVEGAALASSFAFATGLSSAAFPW